MTQNDRSDQADKTGKVDSHIETMISGKLRQLYDGIVDEGTPDRLLDLLEKLDAAEEAAKARSETP